MTHVAVLLSGCGVYDGSEIHEAVLVLLALQEAGAKISMIAPNIDQSEVVNHLTGEKSDTIRNVLVESARIARSDIHDLAEFDLTQVDALIFPGGFGVAKNLSNFATQGVDCKVQPQVASALKSAREHKIPMGFACISPVLASKVFKNVHITLGDSDDPAVDAVQTWHSEHSACTPSDMVCDHTAFIASTPAYMNGTDLPSIRQGIKSMVDQVLSWAAEESTASILKQLPEWRLDSSHLYRTWKMKDFMHALAWVQKIAVIAEEHAHHPDLELGWGYVRMTLFTHDANAITAKDLQLALAIEALQMP
jgi:enhancing lycopene biosynthesis protein 2/pterin-4a-carbinolamine dehydratase